MDGQAEGKEEEISTSVRAGPIQKTMWYKSVYLGFVLL